MASAKETVKEAKEAMEAAIKEASINRGLALKVKKECIEQAMASAKETAIQIKKERISPAKTTARSVDSLVEEALSFVKNDTAKAEKDDKFVIDTKPGLGERLETLPGLHRDLKKLEKLAGQYNPNNSEPTKRDFKPKMAVSLAGTSFRSGQARERAAPYNRYAPRFGPRDGFAPLDRRPIPSTLGRMPGRQVPCKLGCERFFASRQGMLHHVVDVHLKMDRRWVAETLMTSNIPGPR